MTSSERHLKHDQPRWDFENPLYKKNRDVFMEPGLFSIIVLAHGRPEITRQTVLGTLENVKLYSGEVEIIFIENGECDENYKFFDNLLLERKVIIRQRNYGINEALNQGWALSRGEYIMILENDWETHIPENFLGIAKDIFEEQPSIGLIQLRDPLDPHENHGSGKPLYNPFSCHQHTLDRANVSVWKDKTKNGHNYLIANHPNGFNNNPILIRKLLYRECGPYPEPEVGCDPRHGETEMQQRVAKTDWLTAYIGAPLYWHMGKVQTQAI